MQATQMKQRVTFRNILFATDFSSAANLALPYAAGLARTCKLRASTGAVANIAVGGRPGGSTAARRGPPRLP
jgi:hypothetical protein